MNAVSPSSKRPTTIAGRTPSLSRCAGTRWRANRTPGTASFPPPVRRRPTPLRPRRSRYRYRTSDRARRRSPRRAHAPRRSAAVTQGPDALRAPSWCHACHGIHCNRRSSPLSVTRSAIAKAASPDTRPASKVSEGNGRLGDGNCRSSFDAIFRRQMLGHPMQASGTTAAR